MQISTRVGVVQAIWRFPRVRVNHPKVNRAGLACKHPCAALAPQGGVRSSSKKENRTLAGPVCSSSARGPTITFQRGTADGVTTAIWEDGQSTAASTQSMPSQFLQTTQRVACQPCGLTIVMSD